jgi:hypothetical protein
LSITGTWPQRRPFHNFTKVGVLQVEYTGRKSTVFNSIPTNHFVDMQASHAARRQVSMKCGYDLRTFAIRGGDALNRTRADVADREDATPAYF